jgi:hypothetical protein
MGLGEQLGKLPVIGAFLEPTSFEVVMRKDDPKATALLEEGGETLVPGPEPGHATEESQADAPVPWVEGEPSPFFDSSYALDIFYRRVLTSPSSPPPLDITGVFADHRV